MRKRLEYEKKFGKSLGMYMEMKGTSYEIGYVANELIQAYLLKASRRRVLNKRHYKVLRMRLIQHKTFEDVGQEFGVTRERVRQIEAKALVILRKSPKMKGEL